MAGTFQPDVAGNPFANRPVNNNGRPCAGHPGVWSGLSAMSSITFIDREYSDSVNASGLYLKLNTRYVE